MIELHSYVLRTYVKKAAGNVNFNTQSTQYREGVYFFSVALASFLYRVSHIESSVYYEANGVYPSTKSRWILSMPIMKVWSCITNYYGSKFSLVCFQNNKPS